MSVGTDVLLGHGTDRTHWQINISANAPFTALEDALERDDWLNTDMKLPIV